MFGVRCDVTGWGGGFIGIQVYVGGHKLPLLVAEGSTSHGFLSLGKAGVLEPLCAGHSVDHYNGALTITLVPHNYQRDMGLLRAQDPRAFS
jgi:hypothetical protein